MSTCPPVSSQAWNPLAEENLARAGRELSRVVKGGFLKATLIYAFLSKDWTPGGEDILQGLWETSSGALEKAAFSPEQNT